MFKEYDIVFSVKKLNDNVPENTMGTILYIYNSTPVEYEVEFVDSLGDTLDILTVSELDIRIEKK